MSRHSESRQIVRGRGHNPFPVRDRSTPGPLLPAGRITRASGVVARRAETNASPGPSGSTLFSSASNVGIHGGNMISVGGNITIINAREEESTSMEPCNNEVNTAEREALREGETTSIPAQRPQALSQRSCEVYYRNLVVKGRGSPLWIPEPSYNLPVQCQRKGISIGDVGVLSASGSFTFFFNICLPHDHPINQMGVPEGFIPLSPPLTPHNIQMLQEFSADSYVASESIEISRRHYSDSLTTDLIFESSAEEGAVLTVPHGARSEDLVNTLRFRGYIAKHIENWYRYIIGVCGCEAKNGDVRLVIGCDKTDVWGMAAFVKSAEAVRLRFQPISMGQSYKWEYSGSFDTRTGPDPEAMERLRQSEDDNRTRQDTIYNNQCLFARTLNSYLRDNIWKDIVHKIYSEMGVDPEEAFRGSQYSSAIMQTGSLNPTTGNNSLDGHVPGGPSVADRLVFSEELLSLNISNVSTAMMAHPSTLINELLWRDVHHKYPTAKMIITEDGDWISVLQTDDPALPEPEELYKRIIAQEPDIIADLENDFISLHFVSDDPISQDLIPPPAVPSTSHTTHRQMVERTKAVALEKERQRNLQQAGDKHKVEEQRKHKKKQKSRQLLHIDGKYFKNGFPRLRISRDSRPEEPTLPTMAAKSTERADDAPYSNQGFSGPVAEYENQHPSTSGTNIDPSQDHYATRMRMAPAQHSSTREIFSSLSSSRPYLSPYTAPPLDVTNPPIPMYGRSTEPPLPYSPDFLLMGDKDNFPMHDSQTSNPDFHSSELFGVVEPYNEAVNNIQNFDRSSFESMPRVYHSFSIDDARLSEGQNVVDDLGVP